jgi:hypothetical protein
VASQIKKTYFLSTSLNQKVSPDILSAHRILPYKLYQRRSSLDISFISPLCIFANFADAISFLTLSPSSINKFISSKSLFLSNLSLNFL